VSTLQLAEEWCCGRQVVRNILENLVSDGFITIQPHHKWGSLITICKYGKYQCNSSDGEKFSTQNNQLNNQLNNQPNNQLNNQLKNQTYHSENKRVLVGYDNADNQLNNQPNNQLNNQPNNQPMYARTRVLSSDSKEDLKNLKEKNTVVEVRTADAQPPPSDDFKLSNDIPESRRKKPVQPITFDYDGDMNFHGDQLPHFVEVWKQSFPAIDVVKEIGKARAWLSALSVPKRKKDIRAFLSRWLGKAQEQYDRQISMQGGGRMSPAEYAREKKLARDQEAGLVVSKDYSSVKMPDWLVAQIREANDKKKTQTGGNNDAGKK
jgi:hypothetical protein